MINFIFWLFIVATVIFGIFLWTISPIWTILMIFGFIIWTIIQENSDED